MSLSTIKTAAYGLLQVSAPSSADDVLMLELLNQARVKAERDHDFYLSYAPAYLTIAETGTLLSTAKAGFTSGAPSGSTVTGIKKVEKAWLWDSTDSVWSKCAWMEEQLYTQLTERADRLESPDFWGDTSNGPAFPSRRVLYKAGQTVFLHEWDVSTHARVYAYQWLPAYASFAAPDDFLIQYGADYLMWSAVVGFNYLKGTFIPRHEGSLAPPSDMVDRAWNSLVLWDSYERATVDDILT